MSTFGSLLELEFWWAQRTGSVTVVDDTPTGCPFRGECLMAFLRRYELEDPHRLAARLSTVRLEPTGLARRCEKCAKVHD